MKAEGVPEIAHWEGLTPDALAYMMKSRPDFEVVYEGVWVKQ
jgi:hypothetical protein